jgi:phage terminase large subunit
MLECIYGGVILLFDIELTSNIFNEVYLPTLLDYEHRIQIYYGGSGSGKSHFAVRRALFKLLSEERTLLVCRKVRASIKASIWQEFVDALREWGILDYVKMTMNDLVMLLPNGSKIMFKGLDNVEKIKSITGIDDILIEEASELTPNDFDQLDLRLRSDKLNQQITLMYNPISKLNWTYERFHANPDTSNAASDVSRDVSILHTTYEDNKFLPKKYIDRLEGLKATNVNYYNIYCLGQYGTTDKIIFTNWSAHNKDELFSIVQSLGLTARIGMDFGFVNDPTVLVLLAYDNVTSTVYVLDTINGQGMLTKDIYNAVVAKGWQSIHIVADSAEPRTIKELKLMGLNIHKAKKGVDSVIFGITWLQQQHIMVADNLQDVRNELNNYTWIKDKNSNNYINKPIDKYNHCIDSIRYWSESIAKQHKHTNNQLKSVLGI